MTTARTLPLIVLAGSDRRPVTLPDEVEGLHPLSGYKAMDIRVAGVPLVDVLLERLEESALFEPLFLAGPRRVYGESRGPARVIDTDGNFGENLEAALTAVTRECPGRPLALTSCDILPEVEELRALIDDYHRHAPLDFWYPLILAPERLGQLGASAWKPEYRVAPRAGAEPRAVLPGHLTVVDPEAIRLPLVYHSFNLAYRSRNRPVLYRLVLILGGVLGDLLVQDLRHLLALRLPAVTVSLAWHAVLLSVHLHRGTSTAEELAKRLRIAFVRTRHRRHYPERGGRLPLVEALSLAKDVDTVEEAEELVQELG